MTMLAEAVVDDSDDLDPPLTVEELLDLAEDELTDYIAENLTADNAWPALLDPQVVKRTRGRLGYVKSLLISQAQSAARRMHPDAYAEWWRTKGQAPIRAIGVRRIATERALRQMYITRVDEQANQSRTAARQLALAVRAHRLATADAGLEPAPADLALWAALDQICVPYQDGDATLAEMVRCGAWTDSEP